MLCIVLFVLELQPQSPAAAKLKLEKLGVEEEAIPSILVDDKITIAAIISKETEEKIEEDVYLLDIPLSSSSSKPISTINAVLIYIFNFTTENNMMISKMNLHITLSFLICTILCSSSSTSVE